MSSTAPGCSTSSGISPRGRKTSTFTSRWSSVPAARASSCSTPMAADPQAAAAATRAAAAGAPRRASGASSGRLGSRATALGARVASGGDTIPPHRAAALGRTAAWAATAAAAIWACRSIDLIRAAPRFPTSPRRPAPPVPGPRSRTSWRCRTPAARGAHRAAARGQAQRPPPWQRSSSRQWTSGVRRRKIWRERWCWGGSNFRVTTVR